MTPGYYRFPTLHADTVVFACEDDLWTVPTSGGVARRLTANLGEATQPQLAPDGRFLAFVGREEGQAEIYLMPAAGGPAQRLTYLSGVTCQTAGWTPNGRIIFANNAGQPFAALMHLYTLDPQGGEPELINIGPARSISYGPQGGVVIGRNNANPARWKRYRGGTAGQIWIDAAGDGAFRPLLDLKGNLDCPIWLGERIYFISDHEGIGNLYSCLPSGAELQRHTHHADYYARNASSDGRRIVYHAGADLYLFDPAANAATPIAVEFHSPQTQRNRKFVSAARYLSGVSLHPQGHSLAITTRGKPFTFGAWEGAVLQHSAADGARYRLLHWLNDGARLIAVTDVAGDDAAGDGAAGTGEEQFVILHKDGLKEPELLTGLDIGRPRALAVNPHKDQIAFSNHRYELLCLDLESRTLTKIDRGKAGHIAGFDWSPDGEWIAYGVSTSLQVSILKLWQAANGAITSLSEPVLRDRAPAFDPQGKYLYFLSRRVFDPVYDNMHFDLNFPRGERPYLITLQKETTSPFMPTPHAPENDKNGKKKNEKKADEPGAANGAAGGAAGADGEKEAQEGEDKPKKPEPIQIDLEGITQRILAFPVPEGRYGRIMGIKDGRVLYSRYPVEGALRQSWLPNTPPAKGELYCYDFKEQKEEGLISGVTSFNLSRDGDTLVYRAGNRLRVLKAGKKADSNSSEANRQSGWIDLSRVKVSVVPAEEWRQMYREAWRLQRDQFWTPDMSQVNWTAVYERYYPLLERVASRAEFSDLMWEMQGELGTSHAYELGGDYRPEPKYRQGYLGADLVYDADAAAWRISAIVPGDVWDEESGSPLMQPGLNVAVGDRLLAINGRRLSPDLSPAMALVNLAEEEVTLTIAPGEATEADAEPRAIVVKTLAGETSARYRAWVENNRRKVHEATNGRIGYLHIPDMGAGGYAEFHRGYLAEVDREGLVVDLRYNRGGHVSGLLLEKLARRRIAYVVSRWGEIPAGYPDESVLGPMVALTNEFAGSDGDIFSHGFKLLGLGPLIGTRTWGGVIGINPQHPLVDGTVTTQPEYSFWFIDVGWGVENYGTDPDIEVQISPQDYAAGVDAQLERALIEIKHLLAKNPPQIPDFGRRPSLALPELPR
jgi:tricorn protease